MFRRLRRLLPNRRQLRQSRWLTWLGPRLHNPVLWRWSRHEVALGAALGVFFSLTLPLAHMPLAAGASVLLRANIPTALATTWITNPVTVGPLYYAAYRIGTRLVGPADAVPDVEAAIPDPALDASPDSRGEHRLRHGLAHVGKPLLAGMAVMATAASLAAYALITALWWLVVWLKRARSRPA